MKLIKLGLKTFRNYSEIWLDMANQKNLIIGKNAQGKTNILEAIYLLSDLRSPRTAVMSDLINFNNQHYEVHATIEKNNTSIDMFCSYNQDKKRELRINNIKVNPKEFKSVVKTVLFSTKDLLLLRGTPQDRRDWLDRAISQVYPAYEERISKYEKIRVQKNNLLKSDFIDETLLEIFNEQLVITGANIIFLRKKFLKEIERHAQEKHQTISNSENLSITYTCPENEIENICTFLRNELIARKKEEFGRRQACVGPHRDDIEFFINNINAVKFASQGQQRTLVLALKLAELEIIKEKCGYSPILLLDDVLAELDDIRQNYLLTSINNTTQTIITSVDTLLFEEDFLKNVQIFCIENGIVKTNSQY